MHFIKSLNEIKQWLEKMKIKDYTIDDKLNVHVSTSVDLNSQCLSFIPVKFGSVQGHFDCSHNYLRSLEGSPRIVNGNFSCHSNYLSHLEGAPDKISGDIYCQENRLKTLENFHAVFSGSLVYYNRENYLLENFESIYKSGSLNLSYEDLHKILLLHKLDSTLTIKNINNSKSKI